MLFKYLPENRVSVLEDLKIRFSPLMSLNDPFECQPLIDMENERNRFIEELIQDLERFWDDTEPSEKTEENRAFLEETRKGMIQKVNASINSCVVGQELMSLLGDNFGVLSLSRTESSLLMWSHYASDGKGIVIGFNDEHEFFRQRDLNGNITRPIPVVYSEKRRKVVPGEERYYEKLLCEKPRDWAYEEEERLFRTFLTKEGAVGKDGYGLDVVLTDFPKEAIKCVYFGYRSSDKTKNRVISAITKNSIDCILFDAKISDDEYRVIFSEHTIT